MADTTLGWRFINPRLAERHYPYSMGETAENVAERWGVSRERQDAFALESQQRAVAAIEAGRFADQIVPIAVPQRKGEPARHRARRAPARRHDARGAGPAAPGVPARRRHRSRPATAPASTTARRRSCSSRRTARASSACARWRASSATAVAGVDPAVMGIGPIPATRKALERAGIGDRGPRPRSSSTRPSPPSRSSASTSSASIRPGSTSTAARSRSAIRWA